MLVDGTHLIIAAEWTNANVQVEVKAITRLKNGWLVVKGYNRDMSPILTVVSDRYVLAVLVESEPVFVTVNGEGHLAHDWTLVPDDARGPGPLRVNVKGKAYRAQKCTVATTADEIEVAYDDSIEAPVDNAIYDLTIVDEVQYRKAA